MNSITAASMVTRWLPTVEAGWKVNKLGFASTVKARLGWKGLKADEYVDDGFIFLSTPNIKENEVDFENVNYITEARYLESPEIMLQEGDVLIAKDGSTLGITNVIRQLPRPATVNSSIAVIRPRPEILDSVFLAYFLQSDFFQSVIQRMKGGMGVPHLFQADLRKFELLIPPRSLQPKIADFLDRETARIDELLAKKNRLLQMIDGSRRAEVTIRVTQGLLPGIPLRQTGEDYLGCIPAHWTTPPLYARYSVALGKMLDARQITGAFLMPYLRNVDVQWDRINTDDLPQMDISPEEYDRFLLRKGDLLVCEGGEVGRCSIWRGDLSPCGYQKALLRMRPLRSDEHVRYMFYTLAHVAASGYFAASGSPNTISHLTAEKLRVFRFPKPPLNEQVQISDYLDAFIASLRQTEGAIQRAVDLLREYRTALISGAVTGQIDVRTYRKEPEAVLEDM